MPVYQFHRFPEPGDTEPLEHSFFSDAAAIRFAIGPEFPDGCDVWQGQRYVGGFHGASAGPAGLDSTAPASQTSAAVGAGSEG